MITEGNDDRFLAELREVASRVDPPPPEVLEAARLAFGWRDFEAVMAELVYDSRADRELVGSTRGTESAQIVAFEVDDRGLEIEVRRSASGIEVTGQLTPPASGRVEFFVGSPDVSATVTADDLGRFQADGLPTGPLRLRWTSDAGGHGAMTPWMTA